MTNHDENGNQEYEVRAAANSFLQWAKENHLLSRPAIEDAADLVEEGAPLEQEIFFFSQKVQDVFRRKAINLVGYNSSERKIVVFTHNKLSVGDRKVLPTSTENGVQVDYIQGGVPYVKGSVPAPLSHRARPDILENSKMFLCQSRHRQCSLQPLSSSLGTSSMNVSDR